ncbi:MULTISPECIES: hypothetical protein [Bradyrhizobium]|uniref:hypothetical protein n=1 Tax=Bradyrhizobium elkanii TaxID=29448 RepID=UPI002714935C|nr:hypothetical protein [Bradyrhizobium elkanii]WLA45092.1 hypothetical protein QIH80_24545 [Bradyrhizobium elkanii]WLB84764.1 hypothetical protein QIH83_20355 [Bradyrhizobium elkanii]
MFIFVRADDANDLPDGRIDRARTAGETVDESLGIIAAFAAHGRIAQPVHYNDFADHSVLSGIPHAGDVLSNIGFALVAIWAGWRCALTATATSCAPAGRAIACS